MKIKSRSLKAAHQPEGEGSAGVMVWGAAALGLSWAAAAPLVAFLAQRPWLLRLLSALAPGYAAKAPLVAFLVQRPWLLRLLSALATGMAHGAPLWS